MKKNQVNSILVNQTRRRNMAITYICLITIVFASALGLLMTYVKNSKAQYIRYTENGNIEYNVKYKENDYFDNNVLNSNRQYIASLIDKINAEFNYKIALEESNVEFKYSYKVDANIIVKDKHNQNLYYDKSETLIEEKEKITSLNEVNINEKIEIDYDKYNGKIRKFVNVYDLENAESFLNINMYVKAVGSCEDLENDQEKQHVISLEIPLTKETIAINFVDDIVNSSNNLMKCNSSNIGNTILLFLSIILVIVGIGLIIYIIRYEIKTRTAETIYEKELKKILNNYGSSIQVIGNEFDFKGYQLLRIENFYDLLEISDKLRQPILMKENTEKNSAYFVIPSVTKILYVYRMKISYIKREIDEKNKKHLEEL